jgi:hypothetical protein
MNKGDRETLQRRLEQARRIVNLPTDDLTQERLWGLVSELEKQLAENEGESEADARKKPAPCVSASPGLVSY